MGATVIGKTIYISKDLAAKLTPRERKVLLAHELSHWKHRDYIKMFFIKLLGLINPNTANSMRCAIEIRADKEAILKTKDVKAFKALLLKLNRDGAKYPSIDFSIQMANNMRDL
uniref:Putative peptidase n=1 Tax=viral metagenome TaxID=1070528 RepID=A0A6H1ZF67_9ZZZZ